MRRHVGHRLSAAAVAAIAATLALGGFTPVPGAAAETPPLQFSYTGATQTYQVPTDGSVCFVSISAAGANGGDAAFTDGDVVAPGGAGGSVTAVFAVTPGDTLALDVGGRGSDGGQTPSGATGGFGGGAIGGSGTPSEGEIDVQGGGAGGGGATTIRNDAGDVILVAGGGGGAGTLVNPGGTGGAGGQGGGAGSGIGGTGSSGGGGGGGTPTAGGAGGLAGGGDATAGTAGTAGQGGLAGNGASSGLNGGGGGGGGGFFGGGGGGGATGGGAGGGGGGGAGFVASDTAFAVDLPVGAGPDTAGNGSVAIRTASCAVVLVDKQLDGAAVPGTTFTVHVGCTSVSADVTFDEHGDPTNLFAVEARPGDTCTITETVGGGATSTAYSCEQVIGASTCGADGRTVTFSPALEPHVAHVTVTNSFAVRLAPRFTG